MPGSMVGQLARLGGEIEMGFSFVTWSARSGTWYESKENLLARAGGGTAIYEWGDGEVAFSYGNSSSGLSRSYDMPVVGKNCIPQRITVIDRQTAGFESTRDNESHHLYK